MKNIYSFIRHILYEIGILAFSILIFSILFLIEDVSVAVLVYCIGFVLFFAAILWTIRYINYEKERSAQEELALLEEKLRVAENEILNERQEIQNYFLLWLHQMKTPITTANLLAVDETQLPEKRLRDIRQELVRIESYSNMAMSYLKLISPTTDLDLGWVDLDAVMKSIIKAYRIFFIAHKIRLDFRESQTMVLSDARWLHIMLEQFISNAVKYAKNEYVKIYFQDKSLVIEDGGIGIREEDLPKIFDRGYSGYNGRLNEKSTGLGLFLVNGIAQRLNHRIDVESVFREGTTFTIHFQEVR